LNKHVKTVLFWLAATIGFSGGLWALFGLDTASQFLNVYTTETVLSVDNLAIFSMIFQHFGVELSEQGRYLKWGIAGAWFFRALCIAMGSSLLLAGHWVLYIFAAILLYQCFKMWGDTSESEGLGKKEQFILNFIEKWLKLSPFVQVVLALELCDIAFAVDSIPASFTVSQNPFIIWSANVFAIMGLRSLYFVVADILEKYSTVKQYGVPAVLGFIGLKIVLGGLVEIPTWTALLITISILVGSRYIPVISGKVEKVNV
jgi:tellurite resistance protein TerC